MASTPENCSGFEVHDGIQVLTVSATDYMDILGSVVHRTGGTHAAVDHRLAKASAAFWAEKHLYRDGSSPLPKRFQRFATRIVPKVIHGCGSWAWSQAVCKRLLTWEARQLRTILGAKRRLGELFVP